ncbi:hypothetical protein [Psychrobacter cryohalolentis]|uniref:hypothetical protein n=1 Tax=Psychrobacter cryohalolentis TaxID=330922 RepID=UPI003F827C95
MKTLKPFSFKTVLSASLAFSLIGVTAGCAVAGPGYDNYPIYNDNSGYNYAENNRAIQQLRQDLRRKGYNVMDIRTESYRGNRVLTVLAKKNNQAYELKYSSPDLRLISSTKKPWSNVWDDKNDYKDNGKYKDKHYKNEDSIKNESRYPAIKRRAINKVEGMGYRVKDIEFEQKNNRGVFEIEAKRGSQEYEITLGYPNLNVIKIKKD